jgi:hypothetical protein
MGRVSPSVAAGHQQPRIHRFRSSEPESSIGPARGIFYAMLFGVGAWLVVLAAVEGVRLLLGH